MKSDYENLPKSPRARAAMNSDESDTRMDDDRLDARDPTYNWKSSGPGGCDSHNIEHPCGRCITGRSA